MINTKDYFNQHHLIDMFWRRKWYIFIPFALIVAGSIIFITKTPRVYKTTTTVLVNPQNVSEDLIRSTITTNPQVRFRNLSLEILSRSRLEKIISEFNLYPQKVRSLPTEKVVDLMRRDIQLEINPGGWGHSGVEFFSLSYVGQNPPLITKVTNKLASLFIEENSNRREQQAQGTVDFLETEMIITKQKLDKEDQQLTNYKRKYLYELPDQRDANLRVLEQLQTNRKGIVESIKAAEDRKLTLQNKLADLEISGYSLFLASGKQTSKNSPGSLPLNPLEQQLNQLRAQLSDLRLRYTENYPDLIPLQKKINELEKETRIANSEKEGETAGVSPEVAAEKRYYRELKFQLASTDKEIQKLVSDERKNSEAITNYRARVENTPIREITLSKFNRDYNQVKETYQTLLKKIEIARQGENLERRQKSERYKVIDTAQVPNKPFKPDIQKILLLGVLAGLGAGLGLAFIREQMDRSFRQAEDLETTLGLRVLANIPKIEAEAA